MRPSTQAGSEALATAAEAFNAASFISKTRVFVRLLLERRGPEPTPRVLPGVVHGSREEGSTDGSIRADARERVDSFLNTRISFIKSPTTAPSSPARLSRPARQAPSCTLHATAPTYVVHSRNSSLFWSARSPYRD